MALAVGLLQQPQHRRWFAATVMALSIAIVPTQVGVASAALSKSVPAAMAAQFLSLLMMAGTVGRITGPLWGGTASLHQGQVYVGMLAVAVVGAASLAADYSQIGQAATARMQAPKAPAASSDSVGTENDMEQPLLAGSDAA
jgi:hypothetical protein